MPDDYGYINARVKSMRTKLLDGRALDAAIDAGSYQEFLRVLADTPLSADLAEATAPGAGLPELDAALSRNLFGTVQKVLGMASGDARDEIETLVMRYDLNNLKALARGLASGRSADDIAASFVPGGSLKPAVLETAARSGDLNSAAQAVSLGGHPLARAFRDGVAAYNATGRTLDLEVALDKGYYLHASRSSKGNALGRFFSRDIDIANALIARQQRGQEADASLFVRGGRDLNEASFARAAAGDSAGMGAVGAILEAPTMEEAERLARNLRDDTGRAAAAGDPLGVGVVLDFLRRKEQEIARLRFVARGKFYGLDPNTIRQEVSHA